MLNLAQVVRQLKNERDETRTRLSQLDNALKVLGTIGVGESKAGRRRATPGKRRPMSAAAKNRIAAAQRARWAKWRKAQKAH
jgi:hypothetical protein